MKDVNEERDRELDAVVAYHQAGHAVAAVALRRGIQLLTITPDGNGRGRMVTTSPLHSLDDIDARYLWRAQRNLVLIAAGPSAHAQYVGRSTLSVLFEPECDYDRRLIADLLADLGRGRPKLKFIPEFGEEVVIDFLPAVEETVAVASLLVRTYWCAVELVATELIEKRTLTGKQVRRIVAPHLGE